MAYDNKNKRVRFDDLEEETKKKKKFNLFDFMYSRRKDNYPDEDRVFHERTLKYFFPFCWHNFSRIFNLNLLFIFGNFPIFIIMLALSQNLHEHVTCPVNPLYAPLYGAFQMGISTPVSSAFYGLYGASSNVALWTTAATVVLFIGLGLLLFTFGPITVGTTYVHRNIVKGDPIFLWEDFRYAIKRNLRQSLIMGAFDLIAIFVLLYDIYFFYLNPAMAFSGGFIVISLALLIIYLTMRFYIYLMLITFKLSIFKILKNAFIFSILGFKRNFMAFVGIFAVIVINYTVAVLYIPLGVVLPFMISLALCQFIAIYAAWPKIKEIMIDPYTNGTASRPSDNQNDEENEQANEGGEPADESAAPDGQ